MLKEQQRPVWLEHSEGGKSSRRDQKGGRYAAHIGTYRPL